MIVKLGDICNIQSGGTPSRSVGAYWENGTIPWVKIGDMTNKFLCDTSEKITSEGLNNSSAKLFPKGTILYTIFATLGEVAILNIDATTNQAIAGLTPDVSVVDTNYLYHFLCSQKDNVMEMGRGVAQNNINMKMLRHIKVPLPSMSEQLRIAYLLDKVSNIISMRNKQLKQIDELIKSRFIELFGDPIKNEKSFPTRKGIDCFKLSNGKAVPENKRFSTGIPAYGGNGISWYTDELLFENDTIVVGRVGFQSGNVHFVQGPLWITDNAMYISKFFGEKFNLVFLTALMEHIDFTQYQDAGDLKKITQKPFMEMEYVFPPIELQKQFHFFVEQTDKLKLEVKQSLEKLETLKKSLMQEYFG